MAGRDERGAGPPVAEAVDIDSSDREDVLEARLGQADGAGAAEVADAEPLREGPFDSGSGIVARLELDGRLIRSGRLQGERLGLGADGQMTRPLLRGRALGTLGTGTTILVRGADVDDLLPVPIAGRGPLGARVAPGHLTRQTRRASQSMAIQAAAKPASARAGQRLS